MVFQQSIFTRILSTKRVNLQFIRPMTKLQNMSNPLKLRPARLNLKKKTSIGLDSWSVVGYSTADRYNLLSLSEKLAAQVSNMIYVE